MAIRRAGTRGGRWGGGGARRALVAVIALGGALRGATGRAAPPPPARADVVALDDETRIRRADVGRARALGQALPAAGGTVELVGWRDEVVAFQVAVVAGSAAVEKTALWIPPLGGAPGVALPVELFREHYLPVRARSRNNRRPRQSLGWLEGARPGDGEMLGDVPDALLPAAVDATAVSPGPAVPASQTGAFWVDVWIPPDAPAGDYHAPAQIVGDGAVLARFEVRVKVLPPTLPYAATSMFVYYEADRLAGRLGPSPVAERGLWRLLHAHHIDALAPLAAGADVDRLRSAYDGSLFAAGPARAAPSAGEAGYRGPGAGVAPRVVALGTYGILGAPTPASLGRVDEMCARLPTGITDVFLYAIDETCRSPRAGQWRHALAAQRAGRRVQVAQTCDDPPRDQPVDIAMVSAGSFERSMPAAARAGGAPRTWIYNGILPRTGTLLLDADPRGLVANGWIAAAMGIERWFYWESIFWDDGNAGGHGPVDPFATPETFHNGDGDTALGDGLLLYPGRQQGRFAAHSLGVDGVLPSLRLKALRRGIEDAGIIALAAREHPEETARVIARALPAALDEARADRPASWETAPLRFAAARAALRALVTRADPMSRADVQAAFADLAARRGRLIPLAPRQDLRRLARLSGVVGSVARVVVVIVAFLAAAFVAAAWARRRRARRL